MVVRREHRGPWRFLLNYTAIYLCGIAALLAVMLACGKTLIWDPDGVKQHYTVIGYVGQVVRELLSGGRYRMMSFSLGQGMDTLTTMTYNGYTDPLSLLGALFAGNTIETGYALIAFLRMYLAGIAAAVYFWKVGVKNQWSIACAAAIYVFDGYFLRLVGTHPYFLSGTLYLPLMLLCVERILQDRKWLLFTLVTALMLITNFYFAFMNTVVTIVYIVVRLIARISDRGVKQSAGDGFMLLGSYLLGMALSAAVFVPVIRTFLSNSRVSLDSGYSGSMLHYGLDFYRKAFFSLFGPWDGPGNYTYLNFAPLALFGLLALFTVRGGRARQARIALYIGFIALGIPMTGHIMNGMGYVTNRWSYAVGLFVALGCAIGIPRMLKLKRPGRVVISVLALAYAALQMYHSVRTHQAEQLAAGALIVLAAVLFVAYGGESARGLTAGRTRVLLSALLAVTCVAYTLIGYLPGGYGYILEEADRGIYDELASDAAGQFIDDDGVYRVGQGLSDDAQSAIFGYMGTSYYWSLVEAGASEYYQDLYLPAQTTTWHLFGLGGSAPLNAVAAVKYVTQQSGENWVIPSGFEQSGAVGLPDGTSAGVYENAYSLPLGYAYDRVMPVSEYEALGVEDKYQALTAYAICDADFLPAAEYSGAAQELEYTVEELSDVRLDGNRIEAVDGGTMTLAFDAPADAETYLIFDRLDVDVEAETGSQRGGILVESDCGMAQGNVPNPRQNFYFPKKGLAFCLGSGEMHGCKLSFIYSLKYRFDNLRVVSLPLAPYRESVQARRAEGMTDVKLSDDRLEGRISLTGDRILQIAVPYSDGWSARVDGESRPVFRCGGLYMGIALEAGEHAIEMRYTTPGLRAGVVISAAAVVLTIVLAIASCVRRRRAAR